LWVNGLVDTARFSDFWNFAVAIICMVLVILRVLLTDFAPFDDCTSLGHGMLLFVRSSEYSL